MLRLTGPDSYFELDILSYEFASVSGNGWDSEWLEVSGHAQCPRGRWKFKDPCITTFELKHLASWMRDLPAGGPDREIGFTEPNLRFEHVEEAAGDALYVHFAHEASPPWVTDDERFDEGYALHIPFASINFTEVADAIDAMCKRYPIRANRNGG